MWIRCKVERSCASFDVLMKDGANVTFRRYPNVGVHLAHVPTPAHQRLLLGITEGYEPWQGADPTDGATQGEAAQGAILSAAAQVKAQQDAAASAGTTGAEKTGDDGKGEGGQTVAPTAGSVAQMSGDELRAFAREQGLSLPANMKRENAERRVIEFLQLKHEQELEALGAGAGAGAGAGEGGDTQPPTQ